MSILTKDLIKGFVGACLLKNFDGQKPIPPFHEELWEMCTSPNRYIAAAFPRGHGKSTAVTFAYALAAALFRERKFILIVSDSEYQAAMFLGQIKAALQENEDIIKLFRLKKNEKGIVEFVKETETDIIVEFEDGYKFRIIAKGSEQKMRGLLWDFKRPDLMILDDMESDEQVMNKDRRDKFKKWFYGALLPALSEDGIIRYVGTILHADSMLENLMPKWNGPFTVQEDLKQYQTKYAGLWRSVKYKAHNQDFSKILWPERWNKEQLKALQEDYVSRGLPEQYSQEYLNIPIDEASAFFRKQDFAPLQQQDKEKELNYYITSDMAISESERADWTVFVVGGVDADNILHIKKVVRARMDGREIVDTMISLQRIYNPIAFGIEETQISKAIGPYLNVAMLENNVFINIVRMKPHRTDKQLRAQSIRARMRAGGVKFDKAGEWYQLFEEELMTFPRAKHDDQVDAFAYLGLLLDKLSEALTPEEREEEDYRQEMEDSLDDYELGRNMDTGY